MILHGVREYAENGAVELLEHNGRRVILATNQGGHDCTMVDLDDLLEALKEAEESGPFSLIAAEG